MITYAIGDIHGCLKELEQLYARIGDYHVHNHFGVPMKFVFVGDYIDRGPDSKGVIDWLIRLRDFQPNRDVECVFLRGNHEDMFMNDLGLCLCNGGIETLKSYGYVNNDPIQFLHDNFPDDHREFFLNTEHYHTDGLRTYVHAGISRTLPLDQQKESVLLWVRDQFLLDDSEQGGYVVHGHTPIGVEMKTNRLNVDSGCVFGGVLTAAVFEDHAVMPTKLIQSDRHSKQGPY